MKLYFSKVRPDEAPGIDENLVLKSGKAVIVQPSAIMRVPINVVIKVEGNGILQILPHPDLITRVGDLFPSPFVLDQNSPEKPLEVTVRNLGNNPIHIMEGNPLGIGHCLSIENPEMEEYDVPVLEKKKPKSKPPKKNKDVQFEVK